MEEQMKITADQAETKMEKIMAANLKGPLATMSISVEGRTVFMTPIRRAAYDENTYELVVSALLKGEFEKTFKAQEVYVFEDEVANDEWALGYAIR
jgi:hypothetical protein